MVEIREEGPGEPIAIRDVNKRAFGHDQEGHIVDALRSNRAALLSLVATLNGRIVGHIMYSPASVGELAGEALGPLAVLPEHQRQGIGTRLIEVGNRRLKESGCPFTIVVRHPNYYPRFGFRPARAHGIKGEGELPDDIFMLLVLYEAEMQGLSELAKYRPEFSKIS